MWCRFDATRRGVTTVCRVRAAFGAIREHPAARHARAREHGRDRLQERRGAQAPRRGRAARRLQTAAVPADRVRRQPEPARRVPPRAADAVARPRKPAPEDRRLPLLLRPHAGAAPAAVSDPPSDRTQGGLPLRRLGHPRQDARAARVRAAGGRARGRVVRRHTLGARRRGDPPGDRSPAPSSRSTSTSSTA